MQARLAEEAGAMMLNVCGQAMALGEQLRRGPGVPLDLDSAESRVDKKSAERRAPSAERRAPSAERRAPSAERRAPSAERRAPSAERRALPESPRSRAWLDVMGRTETRPRERHARTSNGPARALSLPSRVAAGPASTFLSRCCPASSAALRPPPLPGLPAVSARTAARSPPPSPRRFPCCSAAGAAEAQTEIDLVSNTECKPLTARAHFSVA